MSSEIVLRLAAPQDRPALIRLMGELHDFEAAIEMGSTNIRVGSTIFGARIYPNKK